MKKKKRHAIGTGHIALGKMISALVDGATMPELAIASGLSRTTIRLYIRRFRAEKAVHVSGWEKDVYGRTSLRVYTMGRGRDVPRPKPRFTAAELARNRRIRMRHADMIQMTAGAL